MVVCTCPLTAPSACLILHAAPTIALAMGEKGVITRILAAKFGGYLTFAAMSPEKASAPGQPSIQSLLGRYNFKVRYAMQACLAMMS